MLSAVVYSVDVAQVFLCYIVLLLLLSFASAPLFVKNHPMHTNCVKNGLPMFNIVLLLLLLSFVSAPGLTLDSGRGRERQIKEDKPTWHPTCGRNER